MGSCGSTQLIWIGCFYDSNLGLVRLYKINMRQCHSSKIDKLMCYEDDVVCTFLCVKQYDLPVMLLAVGSCVKTSHLTFQISLGLKFACLCDADMSLCTSYCDIIEKIEPVS